MLFEMRLLAYRLLKPLQYPASRILSFPQPTTFVGPGSARSLCDTIAQCGLKRVLIVTDAMLVRLGLVEPLRAVLAGHGVDVAVHDAITPDPTCDVLQRGYQAARAHRTDGILAIGGGSVLDAAKVIDAMLVSGKSPEKLIGLLKVGKPLLPLFAIPTTAGTGSEVTVAAVVTDPVKRSKAPVIDPRLVPRFAALDPELTRGLPAPITAATGMDALTHAVEAHTNRWPHPDTGFLSLTATRLIFANLPKACANGGDLAAREAMLLASYYAGLSFTKAYVGYVHAFSHKLGGMYGVPHGLANAIVLPYVLDFIVESPLAERRLAELAVAIGAGREGEPQAALARRFIERVRELNRTVGIPEKVAKLQATDIPEVARAAMIEAHREYPVARSMSLSQAEALLRGCLA